MRVRPASAGFWAPGSRTQPWWLTGGLLVVDSVAQERAEYRPIPGPG